MVGSDALFIADLLTEQYEKREITEPLGKVVRVEDNTCEATNFLGDRCERDSRDFFRPPYKPVSIKFYYVVSFLLYYVLDLRPQTHVLPICVTLFHFKFNSDKTEDLSERRKTDPQRSEKT